MGRNLILVLLHLSRLSCIMKHKARLQLANKHAFNTDVFGDVIKFNLVDSGCMYSIRCSIDYYPNIWRKQLNSGVVALMLKSFSGDGNELLIDIRKNQILQGVRILLKNVFLPDLFVHWVHRYASCCRFLFKNDKNNPYILNKVQASIQ